MAIFLIQGGVIAWFGVALGVLLGALVGYNAGDVAAFPRAPVPLRDLRLRGVHRHAHTFGAALRRRSLWIAGIAMLITLLATIYPALRASRVPPADALRYE